MTRQQRRAAQRRARKQSEPPYHFYRNGQSEPFDPERIAALLTGGCILCGATVVCVGSYLPTNDDNRAMVLKLRQHAVPPGTTPGLNYGLCLRHSTHVLTGDREEAGRIAARVEDVLVTLANRVVLQ